MQTSVTFKNIAPSDPLRDYVTGKLNRLDKYLNHPAEATVVLSVEKHRHIAEVNISGDRLSINGKESTEDMYAAIDMVLDKIDAQVKKSKEKQWARRGTKAKGKNRMPATEETSTAGSEPQVFIEEIEYKPMDVDEAILQMNLTEHAFLMFTNARTDRINVLYRRTDGNLGLIQPSTGPSR